MVGATAPNRNVAAWQIHCTAFHHISGLSYRRLGAAFGPRSNSLWDITTGTGWQSFTRHKDQGYGNQVHQGNCVPPTRRTLSLGRPMYRRTRAFEIAQQFQAKGQRIALLVLFDTPAPINLKTHTWQPFTIDDSPTGAFNRNLLQPRRNQRLLFAFLKIIYIAYLGGESFLPQTLQRVNHQAFRKYAPSVYQGQITYFWARESGYRHYSYGRQWSWGQLAGGGLDLHSVPGDRTTMMREPHVQVLAGRLRAILETISK